MPKQKENPVGKKLQNRIENQDYVFAPNIWSPSHVKIADLVGIQNFHVGGGGIGRGIVDEIENLVDRSEMVQAVSYICKNNSYPVTCDIQTGWGDAINIQRTVREFENIGAAGLQIEDQESEGKRCGHVSGKRVVDQDEAEARIRATIDGKQYDETVIIARIDAKGADNIPQEEGTTEAIERARIFLDAGADILYPEFITTDREFPVEFAEKVHETHPNAVFKANYSPNINWSEAEDEITIDELADIGYKYITASLRTEVYSWYQWFKKAANEDPSKAILYEQSMEADHPKLEEPSNLTESLDYGDTLEEMEKLYN